MHALAQTNVHASPSHTAGLTSRPAQTYFILIGRVSLREQQLAFQIHIITYTMGLAEHCSNKYCNSEDG